MIYSDKPLLIARVFFSGALSRFKYASFGRFPSHFSRMFNSEALFLSSIFLQTMFNGDFVSISFIWAKSTCSTIDFAQNLAKSGEIDRKIDRFRPRYLFVSIVCCIFVLLKGLLVFLNKI